MDTLKAQCKLPLSEHLNHFLCDTAGEVLDFEARFLSLNLGGLVTAVTSRV